MSDLISLNCPSCGGELNLSKGMDHFYCPHCGTRHVLKESVGRLPTAAMAENFQASGRLTQKQAALLAVETIEKELEALRPQRQAASRPKSAAGCFQALGILLILFSIIPGMIFFIDILPEIEPGESWIEIPPFIIWFGLLLLGLSILAAGIATTIHKRKKVTGEVQALDEKIRKLEAEMEKNKEVIHKSPLE